MIVNKVLGMNFHSIDENNLVDLINKQLVSGKTKIYFYN